MLTLVFTMVLTGSLARISVHTNAVIGPHVRTRGWLELGSRVSCSLKFTVILFADLIIGVGQTFYPEQEMEEDTSICGYYTSTSLRTLDVFTCNFPPKLIFCVHPYLQY